MKTGEGLHPLVAMARRRQKAGSGSVVEEPERPYFTVDFRKIFSVPFAVVEGQATKAYMPARHTLDWDVLVSRDDLGRARADLARSGAHSFRALTISGFSCRLPGGEALDVIASGAAWVGEALAGPNRDGSGQPILSLPYLVVMKLESGRVQDLADVSRMLGCAGPDALGECRAVVGAHLPGALEDFESLAELGKLERGETRKS